jgi:hypothetical protein
MLTNQSENFQKFEFEFLAGIVSNTWGAKIQKNRLYCGQRCSSSLEPCSHARGHLRGRAPASPAPTRAVRHGGEEEEHTQTPLSSPLLSARCRPAWARQSMPTVPRRRGSTPPARAQSRSARLCSRTSPDTPPRPPLETLAPAPFWPIKSPSEHTSELTPAPASSQTSSLPLALSRSA